MENIKFLFEILILGYLFLRNVNGADYHINAKEPVCVDQLGFNRCQTYYRLRACNSHPHRMKTMCTKTCGFCDGKSICSDIIAVAKCEFLKGNGVCYTHANLMQKICAKTCGACEINKKCGFIRCPMDKFCTVNSKGDPYCECPRYCNSEGVYNRLGEVCGTDGQTYKTYCHLLKASCRENRKINVHFYGRCMSDIPCQDSKFEVESGLCKAWKDAGVCEKHQGVLENYCPKTCGFCPQLRAQSPAKCHNTKYGCCWDDKPAKTKSKKDCRKCKDRYIYLCIAFISDCKSTNNKNREFMRSNCPATCRFCHAPQNYNSVTGALLRYHKALKDASFPKWSRKEKGQSNHLQ